MDSGAKISTWNCLRKPWTALRYPEASTSPPHLQNLTLPAGRASQDRDPGQWPKTGERGRKTRQKEGGSWRQLPRKKAQRLWNRWRTRPSLNGALWRTNVHGAALNPVSVPQAPGVGPGTTVHHQRREKDAKAPKEGLLLSIVSASLRAKTSSHLFTAVAPAPGTQ